MTRWQEPNSLLEMLAPRLVARRRDRQHFALGRCELQNVGHVRFQTKISRMACLCRM
jgi:hypothetical protein